MKQMETCEAGARHGHARPDLLYVISHGFSARMVLHSGLIPELRQRGLSVTIAIPPGDTTNILETANQAGIGLITLNPPAGFVSRISQQARPYLFEDVRRNPGLWSKHLRAVNRADRRARSHAGFFLLNRMACRLPPLRKGLLALGRRSLRSRDIGSALSSMRPRAVVSTYPVNDLEGAALLEAQHAGIMTVGQLLSWDNITSKGRWLVVPDRFVAWGPVMVRELAKYYEVGDHRVVTAGVPHFDAHLAPMAPERRSEVLAAVGIDPTAPYLFFGMSSPVFAPTEIDIVEWLATLIEEGRFGRRMQLVVRPHPQNVQGTMADTSWLPRLDAIRSGRVAVDYPRLAQSSIPWSLERRDLERLAILIGGCSVCLNSGSTLSIDAIVQDRPVVLPIFDVGPLRDWWASVRRVPDYIHQRTMIEMGGVTVTGGLAETEAAIERYIQDPTRHVDGRQKVREQELGGCDGRAATRVAEALEGMLKEGR